MPQAIGANARIGMQVETTYATDPGTPDLTKVYFINESLRLARPLIDSEVIQANRNPSQPSLGNYNVAGSIVTELMAYPGALFKAAFGSVSTSAPTHTIKIGSLPSYTIEKGFTDLTTPEYFKYSGCKVNRMSLEIRPIGFQRLTLDWVGAKETVGTSSFDATMTDLGKQSFEGFHIATITEGGGAIATVIQADLVLENDLDDTIFTINTSTPGVRRSLPEGRVKASGTLTAVFEDVTLYNKAIGGTESSLVVVYQLGTGAGTAGNEKLTITVPELMYSPNAPVISGPKGIMVELPFTAYYDDDAAASAIHMELKNTQAAL